MRFLLTIFTAFLLASTSLYAQKLDHRPGYIMVRLDHDISIVDITTDYSNRLGEPITMARILSPRHGIYLLQFDHSRVHEGQLLRLMRQDGKIRAAQFDHVTELRAVPDDPRFTEQWHWLNTGAGGGLLDADIDAEIAWDFTTGGLTANGDTIVVAIIDSGLDYNHEDIAANVWINHSEIPGNGIDDDGNGYVDDVYGWNAYDENGDIWGNSHGLQVAGMVGAVGNNGIGITGMNWNVKLMTIVGGTPESSVIASYAYALEQRILYNESNGERGAFVVATNSSWGIDRGQPADAPLWCDFYDLLGEHGILSACATANRNYDIDIVGDLPTACPSEYMLSITALNRSNQRTFSAYGTIHVDFGAPGEDVLTTRRDNNYALTSGTSFATPVTAGLIALLYSAPCPNLSNLIQNSPSGAALLIRDVIFNGVKPLDDLDSIVRLGGSLNAGNSMQYLMALCADCPVAFAIKTDILNDQEVLFSWDMLAEADSMYLRYRPAGAVTWDTLTGITSPVLLEGLHGCTTYEMELASFCADTTAGFTSGTTFTTDGCCELPAQIDILPGESVAQINWSSVLAGRSYVIQWRPEGTDSWNEESTTDNSFLLSNLTACLGYEVKLYTDCDTTITGFSDILTFKTKGCGNCIDLPYCESYSDDSSDEFIDQVIIGPLVSQSGNNDGYYFNEDANSAIFYRDEEVEVRLKPGFSGQSFREQFRVWIDLNQDGEYTEDEMLIDSILSLDQPELVTTLTLPDSARTGQSRMRVSMAFTSFFNPANQEPCGEIEFGEVEDYCITIRNVSTGCPPLDTVYFENIHETNATAIWPDIEEAIAFVYRYRKAGSDEDYREFATIEDTVFIHELEKCTSYEFQVMTICASDTSGYEAATFTLETSCDVATDDVLPLLTSFYAYPNPVSDIVTLALKTPETGIYNITVYDLYGRMIVNQKEILTQDELMLIRIDQIGKQPAGMYIATVEHNGRTMSKKVIKI